MSRRVLLDTCVLYPASLRDVLLRCAEQGLYQPVWTERILAELQAALSTTRPRSDERRLGKLVDAMNLAFPDASSIEAAACDVVLPDPGDHHVVAGALGGSAETIVTLNVRHFPMDALARAGLVVSTPDTFLSGLFASEPDVLVAAVRSAAADTRRPPLTVADVLESLAKTVPRFADGISRHLA